MTRYAALALLAAIFLCLCSCTDDQIARAQTIVDQTDLRLQQANAAVADAKAALATAQDLASKLGSEQALRVVAQAGDALRQVEQVQAIAKTTAEATHSALDAAKQAQAAGSSSITVIGAAATGALPGILAAVAAAAKWLQALRSFKQTVSGLDSAREQLGEDVWGAKVAPALQAAQDDSTKAHVALVQAQAKAA